MVAFSTTQHHCVGHGNRRFHISNCDANWVVVDDEKKDFFRRVETDQTQVEGIIFAFERQILKMRVYQRRNNFYLLQYHLQLPVVAQQGHCNIRNVCLYSNVRIDFQVRYMHRIFEFYDKNSGFLLRFEDERFKTFDLKPNKKILPSNEIVQLTLKYLCASSGSVKLISLNDERKLFFILKFLENRPSDLSLMKYRVIEGSYDIPPSSTVK